MRRRRAKFWFRLGGWLGHIKTPQLTYRYGNGTYIPERFDVTNPDVTRHRRWLPCSLSFTLLLWSQQLDWDHWDHWALKHDVTEPICKECGGIICE
jgi:hypothetical protein